MVGPYSVVTRIEFIVIEGLTTGTKVRTEEF